MTPVLSFVIPAHDEEAVLGGTLEAVRASGDASGVPYETIVVDDGSTDRTAEIARNAGARVVQVSVRNIAAARNAGGRFAQGDTILFVDADTNPTPDAVRGLLAARQAGAAGGGTYCRLDEPVPRWAHLYARWIWWWMRQLGWASGCFLFVAREQFHQIGGFNESLYASEEIAFSRAIKRRGRFVLLPYPVVTSGRKLRTYSGREILGVIVKLSLRPWLLKRRSELDLWYGQRRADRREGKDAS